MKASVLAILFQQIHSGKSQSLFLPPVAQTWPWLVDAVALASAGHVPAVVPEPVLFTRSPAEVEQTGGKLMENCTVSHFFLRGGLMKDEEDDAMSGKMLLKGELERNIVSLHLAVWLFLLWIAGFYMNLSCSFNLFQ